MSSILVRLVGAASMEQKPGQSEQNCCRLLCWLPHHLPSRIFARVLLGVG